MKYDIIIAGAGMGGIGAAIYFSQKTDLNVLVVEKQDEIGGTAVVGGVNCFEPGISKSIFLNDIIQGLIKSGNGRVQKTIRQPDNDLNCGISADDVDGKYEDTLRRSGLSPRQWRRFMYDPQALIGLIKDKLKDNVEIVTSSEIIEVVTENKHIKRIIVKTGERLCCFEADYFIDATGDIVLSRLAGCRSVIGAESRDAYSEPSAPESETFRVNGVSYMFRLSKQCAYDDTYDNKEDISEWIKTTQNCKKVLAQLNYYPDGDISVNMLPTMTGEEYFSMPHEKADLFCRKRVFEYWQYLKKNQELDLYKKGYRLKYIFPLPGIRESYRLVGQYVLTQKDIVTPISEHPLRDRFIAYADHAMDVHGAASEQSEVKEPYGIPYDCLLPVEIDNMLVACRGASFSHIAASSCRLSRTMFRLGEAAAEGCWLSYHHNISLKSLDVALFEKSWRYS